MYDVYIHTKIKYPGQVDPEMHVTLLIDTKVETDVATKLSLLLTFTDTKIQPSFSTAILGGLLYIARELPQDIPLNIKCSSSFLSKALVTDRIQTENNPLDSNYDVIKSVVSTLQERSGRTCFQKVETNLAAELFTLTPTPISLDIQPDLMFTNPGILLQHGSQRMFTKIIRSMRDSPTRKAATYNLEPPFGPRSDPEISTGLTRNFLWKCMHNIYRVGSFWDHIPNLEMLGQCPFCRVPESLEHIMLECDAPDQQQVWRLTETLWKFRYAVWPKLNWGLILGCGLARFKSVKGKISPAQNRFFCMIISTSMRLIWNLRNQRVFETYTAALETEIRNRWLSLINDTRNRDKLLVNRARFGSLAIKRQLVLNTWSGTPLDEDSLPDDWTRSKGVLVGIRPVPRKIGVG
ncbi:hypothetical protein DFH09DRAFT_1097664 [Mycena vulgaris]|nr:hypothetical protein DFH09DRAFT_1097664 [Mycena vulgaris]